jgi:hypothetical protein
MTKQWICGTKCWQLILVRILRRNKVKVIYIRVHEDVHEVLRLLATREETTIQALGKAAISQFLDMAYQQGKIPDGEENSSQLE